MKMKNKFFITRKTESDNPAEKTLLVSLPIAWLDTKGTLTTFEITKSRRVNTLAALQIIEATTEELKKEIWSDVQYVIKEEKIKFTLNDGSVEIHPIQGLFIGKPDLKEAP